MTRRPRFARAAVTAIELTERDRNIIRHVHRHRFLRSTHVIALVGGSPQQILRRLQLLYHHGYLERPRAQLRYYERGASREIAYGLGDKSGSILRHDECLAVDSNAWNEKNHNIGRVYLDHALLVSDIMVAIEIACRRRGRIRLLYRDELGFQSEPGPFRWRVEIRQGIWLGVIPDRVFALEDQVNCQSQRIYYFLEADRGTMPVARNNLSQTSFRRKLLAYEATWKQGMHRSQLGIDRFRVLTVTTVPKRVDSLVEACSQLDSGHGLFLFAGKSVISGDILSNRWQTGRGESAQLIPS